MFVIGRFVPILFREDERERALVVRMRRDDDDATTTGDDGRRTCIRSVDECEVRVKSYLARGGIRALFCSS